jgi:AraC family transcriptional regulator
MKSRILFRRPQDGTRVDALEEATIKAVSDGGPEWQGVHIELVRHEGWIVDDLMFDGPFIGMNVSDRVTHFEMRCGGEDWTPMQIGPNEFWIVPEGQAFSVRRCGWSFAADVLIDGTILDSLLGTHYELKSGCGVVDDLLSHLLNALVERITRPNACDPRATRAMVEAFLLTLATRHGVPASPATRSALTRYQLRSLFDWVENHLDTPLSVEQMAAHVGMSAAHFSRAFKRATGKTPWGYVVDVRLERAATLLKQGVNPSTVADRCGFSDQAHLSRLFKRRYGSSPAAYSALHRMQNWRPAVTTLKPEPASS